LLCVQEFPLGILVGVNLRPTFSRPLACAVGLLAHSALAEYRFDVWTAESGLPRNSVGWILQSHNGYLWMSTLDGLVRFDGVRFTVFDKANSPDLPSNRLTALYEDRAGDLWIGFEEGLLARYHQGRFLAVALPPASPAMHIQSISGDDRDTIWVLQDGVLLRLKDGQVQPGLPDNLAALFAPKTIGWNPRGTIWVTNQAGLHIFSRGKLTTLSRSNGLPSLRVNQVDEDQYGTWWVATEDAGLAKVRDGKVIKTFSQRNGLPSNRVAKTATTVIACQDHQGNVWVNGVGSWLGCLHDGVFTAFPSAETLASQPLPTAPGLPGSHVNTLFEDREGNLWIATDGSGLFRAREQVVNVLSTRQGLPAGNIYPSCADHAGAIWFGAWDKGLSRLKNGVLTNFILNPTYQLATALCEDRKGRLWFGSYGGVAIFQNGATTLDGVPAELTNQLVSAISQDRSGSLWFAAERGLFRYQQGELSLVNRPDGSAVTLGTVIIQDHVGALWIGTYNGLTRLANGRFTTWTERDGLPSDHVRALYEDPDGTLWIGTYDGGLGRFKDGKLTRFTVKDGLFDNGVFQILEDVRGNFWMSSNRGIHRVSKKELNEFAEGRRRTIASISYGKSDGMLNAECNGGRWPAGVKTPDGKLWFPTQDGLAVIDPRAMPSNLTPPPVVIESFLLDREPMAFDRPLRLPPGKSNIEIQYTVLSYINSERLLFKYRLAGVDNDWVEAGTRRTAYFSHVAPGHYTFTVLAANSDGLWNETGASLAFTVLPAWYQTVWFRGSLPLAVALAVGVVYRMRMRTLEQRRAAQELFSRQLLESQETERKRIAGELHDSLGQSLLVIKNTASLAADPAAAPAEMRGDLASIARLSTDALEEVRAITHALRPPELDRLGLARALEHVVRLAADAAGLRCSVNVEPVDGLLSPTAEIQLYRLVQECLNNVVKHARAGFVEVRVWRNDQCLNAIVQDNGDGFDPAVPHANSKGPGGLGLAGMAERVRLLGGGITIRSQPGSGTVVEASLPINLEPAQNSNERRNPNDS